ncbi:hypothetical protein VP01_880g1 [Puccinia sorghi]|uniref:Uncharacterized protein n=1 Tax=Puccinia sorghi TaxID=27349 RepID=A0A0L6U8C2_9BASI|nr:hypothetical protein VP01_880g1 [Puccinia sorghi]
MKQQPLPSSELIRKTVTSSLTTNNTLHRVTLESPLTPNGAHSPTIAETNTESNRAHDGSGWNIQTEILSFPKIIIQYFSSNNVDSKANNNIKKKRKHKVWDHLERSMFLRKSVINARHSYWENHFQKPIIFSGTLRKAFSIMVVETQEILSRMVIKYKYPFNIVKQQGLIKFI